MFIRIMGLILLLFAAGISGIPGIQASPTIAIPAELKEWVPWVLEGKEGVNCPFEYRNLSNRLCAWPEVLSLDLQQEGGSFTQHWTVYGKSWVALPGNPQHWPQEVSVDGQAVVVTDKSGVPSIQLAKGNYRVAGRFSWPLLPHSIDLPPTTGLLDLLIDKKSVAFPRFEANGRLWLNETNDQNSAAVEDRLQVELFRRVIDEVPLRLVTRLELNVIGQSREVLLGPLLSADYLPLTATGPLPLRLELDGKLRLQVRPGQWVIEIEARHKTPVDTLALPPSDLPDSEIWVFDGRPALRLVEIEGVTAIDPQQTRLPSEWRSLPAYRMTKTETMRIVTQRRGDPEPSANLLTLNRNLWLDFDGGGYTFQDQISGQMRRGWRLSLTPEMILGRAVVNGVDQLVTRWQDAYREVGVRATHDSMDGGGRTASGTAVEDAKAEEGEQGIEVRRGELSIQADGRYLGAISQVPAVGWRDNFTAAQTLLHLPPGWRLLAASGADSVGGASWIDRWTLLDIFLVLIGALAIHRLFGGLWGLLALIGFTLSWHESGAPQHVWLLVIVTLALTRVAPVGRLRTSMMVLRYLSLVGLMVIAIPYLVESVRTALHPQLEQPSGSGDFFGEPMNVLPATAPALLGESDITGNMADSAQALSEGGMPEKKAKESRRDSYLTSASDALDPRAKVQTGPGLPEWRWSTVPIRWSGPVQQEQQLGLTLMPPPVTSTLKLLCALLVLLLGVRLADISLPGRRTTLEAAKVGLMGLLVGASLLTLPKEVGAATTPAPELLQELQQRLLTPPECLPQCAQISRMKLEITPDLLRLLLEVQASEAVAVPVPSEIEGWLPQRVMVDEQPSPVVRGPDNSLWVYIPSGIHQLQLVGSLRAVRTLQLPLPLPPRQIEIAATGWSVKGVHPDGTLEKALQMEREYAEGERPKVLEQTVLPAFVTVARTLHLGLEWRVETEVSRVSPVGSAIALEVPLLAGESVTSEEIRVAGHKAIIQFAPQQQVVRWQSLLEPAASLSLRAATTLDWVEQWRLDISPIWHVELSGIAPIHHQSAQGAWYPQWHPWPGEELTVTVSRPTGIEGKTKTVDQSRLTVKPGERALDASLTLRLRSSQADQHTVQLPEGATLDTVIINGMSQPIRQEAGGIVRLPLLPGEQQIALNWQSATPIDYRLQTPQVNLGLESVNATIEVQLPANRWTLFTFGPQLGPAVLFWGVLLVVLIIATGLGRTRQTPLKTHHWLLLGIGLSQTIIAVNLLVVGWLFAMGWRQQRNATLSPRRFNGLQLLLALLTVAAVLGLIGAVSFGLLGHPDMQISGNGSDAHNLKWYADRSTELLPTATVISVPMWFYRALMLVWSLWLAFALLGWLKWSWHCFNRGGIWQEVPKKEKANNKGAPGIPGNIGEK